MKVGIVDVVVEVEVDVEVVEVEVEVVVGDSLSEKARMARTLLP